MGDSVIAAVVLSLVAVFTFLVDENIRRHGEIKKLRETVSEQEFMIESSINRAYERGWNDRTAFSAPMPFGRVKPAREKSN